ncbi:MAG TPA: hypothetical protein VJB38_02490, partial [Bacteroidota bacterium]|nr:hypothetical protein [Bacteroidota bacterium]
MKTSSAVRKTPEIILFLFLLSVLPSVRGTAQGKEVKPAEKLLYERLGGVYAVATVVDDFIERLLVN